MHRLVRGDGVSSNREEARFVAEKKAPDLVPGLSVFEFHKYQTALRRKQLEL
jgi:hypothetical protein